MGLPEDNFTTINTLCKTNDTDHTDASIVYIIHGVVSVITSFSGLPLNVYVVWLILRGAGSGIGPEFFTLNLALTDILFFTGYLMMPFFFFCPNPLAKVVDFFFGFIVTGHPLFQTCICVERYLAVLHPVLFLKYKPLRYRLTCSGIIWLMVLMTCMVFVLVEDIIHIFWPTLYLILFVVMSFCCLAVLRGLCKPGPGEGERGRNGANQVKMKAFRIISVITFAQFIIIVGNIVVFCANNFTEKHRQDITYGIIFLMMASAFLAHPLLYLHSAGKLHCRASP